MNTQILKRQILLACIAVLILVASGCAGSGMPEAPAQSINPTVVVVQYVTQVVATVTPSPPTATPLPPTEAPVVVNTGFDPFRVEVYYPLMGCPVASRLHAGERAFVANNRNGTLGLHWSANVGDAPIWRKLGGGEVLDILDGPYCRTQSLVWKVIAADDQIGFVSEGNGEEYWLLPMGEKVDKKRMKATPDTGIMIGLPANCRPR
jgi:hypothetical protein